MRGLALEGGGARGAYHIGVAKAFLENNYEFDGFVGTSIGAINAAVLAQGDFEKALDVWMNISMEEIFDLDEKYLMQLSETKFNLSLLSNMKKGLKKIIEGGGVDTSKMKAFIEKYICEDKVRQSKKDFGLVTVSINEGKPYEIFLEDIPPGKLTNYIMASASFPGFRPEIIDEKMFLDGGLYNNCPVNLLHNKGYEEIIAVRTGTLGFFPKVENFERIKVISPRESLGNMMVFTREQSETNIKLGYLDGLRFIKNLRGHSYYLNPINLNDSYTQLISIDDDVILKVGKVLGIPIMPEKRMLFEYIIPLLGTHLQLEKDFDYGDFVIALLEYSAKQKGIDRYQVYDYSQLYSIVKNVSSPSKKEENSLLNIVFGQDFLNKEVIALELLIECLF